MGVFTSGEELVNETNNSRLAVFSLNIFTMNHQISIVTWMMFWDWASSGIERRIAVPRQPVVLMQPFATSIIRFPGIELAKSNTFKINNRDNIPNI